MGRPDEHLPEHDAHLRAALRYTPDADLGAPAALSDAILRAARVATRAPVAAPPVPPRRWFAGLAQAWSVASRPPVIAGMASVVLATLVGLNVWEQPDEQPVAPLAQTKVAAVPDRAPPPTDASAPTVTSIAMPAARMPAAGPAGVAREAPGRTQAAPDGTVVAEATGPQVDSTARSAVQATLPAQARNVSRPPTLAALPAAAPAAPHATESRSLERRAPDRMPPGALADGGAAGKVAGAAMVGPATPSAGTAAAPSAADVSVGTARAERSSAMRARSATPTLSALTEALAAEPQRWRVRRGAEPARAVSPSAVAWLVQLDALAAGRWQTTDVPPVEALRGMVGPEAGIVDLGWERDGVVQQRLWLAADGVRWQPIADVAGDGTRPFWLPVDANAALRLRTSLGAALR